MGSQPSSSTSSVRSQTRNSPPVKSHAAKSHAAKSHGAKSPASKSRASSAPGREQPATDVADVNLGLIVGELVSAPESRTLPSGSVAVSFSLTVRAKGAKTTSVPAVWYDPPKRMLRWVSGDRVIAHGAIVRRFFRSNAGLGSSTEVVVNQAELVRHEAKTSRLITRALASIPGAVQPEEA